MRLSFRWANPKGRMKGTKRRVNGTRRKKGGGAGEKKTGRLPGEQGVQSTITNQLTVATDRHLSSEASSLFHLPG